VIPSPVTVCSKFCSVSATVLITLLSLGTPLRDYSEN
jgi:hypothetical protein